MVITDVSREPAVVDFYFNNRDAITSFDFENFFNKETTKLDYNPTEKMDSNRLTILDGVEDLEHLLETPILNICDRLVSLDLRNRYPTSALPNFVKFRKVSIFPSIDYPGFYMPWHLDNRFIAASGIINVIDNTVSTCFSKIEDTWQGPNNYSTSNIFHRGRTKQFEGTAWLNTEHTWHLLPEVTDVRKVILFNVTFF